MHYIVTFEIDVRAPKAKNDTPFTFESDGLSVGEWIAPQLKPHGINISGITAEDWGWSSHIEYNNTGYMLGFILLKAEEAESAEVIIIVEKKRRTLDKLLLKNKMTAKDPLLRIIETNVRSHPSAQHIEVLRQG